LSDEFAAARAEGRLVQTVPLDAIEAGHLKRDRMVADGEEMSALKASIADRGQQVPVDVVDLGQGRYGLISGWRRLQALRELHAETGEARFAGIRAVLRRPASAAEAYLSMVEENELRVGLSYYERAQVAARAAQADVFDGTHAAIAALFPTASKAKRSKIASFVKVYHGLGDVLQFPWEIGERLGLRLAQALADGQGARLRAALEAADSKNAETELRMLSQALELTKKDSKPANRVAHAAFAGGVELTRSRGALKLSGPGVDEELLRDLESWLTERQTRFG
jgi:ParB/RepB/Spo0J family partition protein